MTQQNILDYIKWRGDLSVETVPLCPVDLLILSEMIYSPLEDLKGLTGPLGLLAARLGPAPDEKEEKTRLSSLRTLIGMIPSAPRYAGAQLRLFTADFSTDEEKQFAAALVSFGKTAVVVFRGTDSSPVGWKEDLNLSFESRVPSQLQAADFLNQCGELAQGFGIETLQVCGHSKGGNLALYAAAACRPEVRQLISRVISFDGPGVCAEIRDTEGYREIESRVASYIPESSVIGLLLDGTENRTVVQSNGLGIFQHNAFLWHLNGPAFETAEGTTLSSRVFAGTFQAYLEKCTVEERQSLVNFLFDLVSACGASHLGEVPGCIASHPLAAARLIRNMPQQERTLVVGALKTLGASGGGSLMEQIKATESMEKALQQLRRGRQSSGKMLGQLKSLIKREENG